MRRRETAPGPSPVGRSCPCRPTCLGPAAIRRVNRPVCMACFAASLGRVASSNPLAVAWVTAQRARHRHPDHAGTERTDARLCHRCRDGPWSRGRLGRFGAIPRLNGQDSGALRRANARGRPERTKRPDLTDERTKRERVGAILRARQRVAPFRRRLCVVVSVTGII